MTSTPASLSTEECTYWKSDALAVVPLAALRTYFFYSVPLTHTAFARDTLDPTMQSEELLTALHGPLRVTPVPVPAFYTAHYRSDHAPYRLEDDETPATIYIPTERVTQLNYFRDLEINEIGLNWTFTVRAQSVGLITLCLGYAGPLYQVSCYRLSGMYLNNDFRIIPTQSVRHLWRGEAEIPEYVSCDEFARALHRSFFSRSGLPVKRHRPLRHEMQIPVTVAEVDTGEESLTAFLERNKSAVAEFVYKPGLWETRRASDQTAEQMFAEDVTWGPSTDSMTFLSYNGIFHARQVGRSDQQHNPISDFQLTSEESVIHTIDVGITTYYFLRLADEIVDRDVSETIREMERLDQSPLDTIEEAQSMHRLTRRIMRLQVHLAVLLEELENADKLIDEQWHIVLLDRLNFAMGTGNWYRSLNARLEQLGRIAHWMEAWRENSVELSLSFQAEETNRRVEILQPLLIFLTILQVVPFFFDLYIGDPHLIVKQHGLLWPSLLMVGPMAFIIYFIVAGIRAGLRRSRTSRELAAALDEDVASLPHADTGFEASRGFEL